MKHAHLSLDMLQSPARECESNHMNNNLSNKQPINNLDGIYV